MDHFIGIDIGGTHIKFGVVDEYGVLSHFDKFHTKEWVADGGFLGKFIDQLSSILEIHKGINKVGIGIPGLVDIDRKVILEVPSIPQLNGVQLHKELKSSFPNVSFVIENDAGAAAIGELIFQKGKIPDNFIFVTIGTGIGGAAIVDRKLFLGGGGNSMEFGHMISRDQKHLEHITGKNGIIQYTKDKLSEHPDSTLNHSVISISSLLAANDELSRNVFYRTGYILGEGLVAVIRIMDMKHIIIGGGISVAFEYILPGIEKALDHYLTEYYLKELKIEQARLGNNAGLIGAVAPFIEPTVAIIHH